MSPPSGGDDSQGIGAAYALCEDFGIAPPFPLRIHTLAQNIRLHTAKLF
jgi:hypothetical protein